MVVIVKLFKWKVMVGMMIGFVLMVFIIGIMELIEFVFMFLFLFLYVVYVVLIGLFLFIVNWFGICLGFFFLVGVIDYVFSYGIVEKLLFLFLVGICYVVVYFIVFYVLIKVLNLKMSGWEDDDVDEVLDENIVQDVNENIMLKGFGGKENF